MSSSRAKQNRPGRRLTAVYRRGFEDGRRAALEAALSAAEPTRCEGCDGYNCDDGCAYPAPASKPAPSVAVKALEWVGGTASAQANTPFGFSYGVFCIDWEGEPYWQVNFVDGRFANDEAAKAAAQADYEDRIRSAISAHVQDVAEREPKEIATWEDQQAFEAWAQGQRYEMHQHPLHYLFMDPKTNAARQGWKAALQFIRDRSAAAPAKQEGATDAS